MITMHCTRSQPAQGDLWPTRERLLRVLICLLFAGLPIALQAHDPGLSTAMLRLEPAKLEAVLVFSVRDVAEMVDLDKNRDGQISKAELADGAAELQKMAPQALEVTFDDQ